MGRLERLMHGCVSPLGWRATRRRPTRAGIDLVEAGHHEIGAGRAQQGLVAEAGDAERGHAAGPCGQDAGGCVLDHQARAGGISRASAASRNSAGSGLPCGTSVPLRSASKTDSSGRPSGKVRWRSMASAFFDDEASASAARLRAAPRQGAPRPERRRSYLRRSADRSAPA